MSDELDRIFYQELRGKTVTPEQKKILEWAEARLKPALHRLILKERREEIGGVQVECGNFSVQTYINGEGMTVEDRFAQLEREIEGSDHG